MFFVSPVKFQFSYWVHFWTKRTRVYLSNFTNKNVLILIFLWKIWRIWFDLFKCGVASDFQGLFYNVGMFVNFQFSTPPSKSTSKSTNEALECLQIVPSQRYFIFSPICIFLQNVPRYTLWILPNSRLDRITCYVYPCHTKYSCIPRDKMSPRQKKMRSRWHRHQVHFSSLMPRRKTNAVVYSTGLVIMYSCRKNRFR